MASEDKEELPKVIQNRIERNRQKAIALKKSKLVSHPYANPTATAISIDKTVIKIGSTRYKDTGGGFLLEEENPEDLAALVLATEEPAIIREDRPNCEECQKPFPKSWLYETYNYNCCDSCKNDEKHKLITKTEAMNSYLLKDCDLEKRDPPLKFITRKNPHNSRWGDMKLYLQLQVEERALQVWGSEEKIEEELEKREEKKVLTKTRKYHKQLKELRMNMRSSLYDRTAPASHTHTFGPETYNEDDDNYTHSCTTCSYVETFEKM